MVYVKHKINDNIINIIIILSRFTKNQTHKFNPNDKKKSA